MELTIRTIETGDVASVIALMREFAAYENLTDYCTVTEERFYAALFGDAAVAEGIVALDGDTPVGYALFYPNFSSFRGQQGMYLEDIYIRYDHRGCGLGKRMLAEVARITAARGFERIDFMVLDWNSSAIHFYEKLGAESNDDETHFKFSDAAFNHLAKSELPA